MDHTLSLASFLKSVPVFGGLEGTSLQRVVDMLDEHTFSPGDVVFQEGELGRTMFLLCDGEVEVSRTSHSGNKVVIVKLLPGETFGEMTLVELQPRSATVTCLTAVTAYSLNNVDLYSLYKEDNYAYVIILQNMCRMLSRRLRKADGRIVEFLASGGGSGRGSTTKAKASRKVAPRAAKRAVKVKKTAKRAAARR